MTQAATKLATVPYEVLGSSDDREAWLALRMTGIGASEIAAVLGESPWSSALQVYCEKAGEVAPDDLSENEFVFWGARLEPVITEVYGQRTGRGVERSALLLRSIEEPWALATLDGETWNADGARWPLEIKNGSGFTADKWAEGPPPHYYLQVQQQLLVTGAPKATVACLLGGNRLVWCDVERDDITIQRIRHAGRAFWKRVQARDVPLPDGSESASRALAALYPHDDPNMYAQLPGELIDVADELEALKETAKATKARVDELGNQIKAALGNAQRGCLPNGTEFSWKEQTRAEYVVKAASFRVLRRHAPKKAK